MRKFEPFAGRLISIPVDNIDTDQIIPARFLKTISKEGLGDQLFYDWRYDAGGRPRADFALNRPEARGARILLAGDNFGCGSSREHAPWALAQFGFRAVISSSFADIFRQNALKNALLPIAVSREIHRELLDLAVSAPEAVVRVDLAAQTIRLPDGRAFSFPIDGFARQCLLEGVDELGYVLNRESDIAAFEAGRKSLIHTLA